MSAIPHSVLNIISYSAFQNRIAIFAGYLRNLSGWRRANTAFTFGLLSALAFAPYGAFPLLWLTFPALIFLVQGTTTGRQAFITGWCFAFGLFLLGLYWIAASMFVDIAHYWWGVPLAVAGLPAFLAIYYGIAAALARRFGVQSLSGMIGFALLWFLADYARGHLLGGFPWHLTGYAWTKALPVLQITSVIGIYGLTLVTLLAACLPACLAANKKANHVAVLASLIVILLIAGWGAQRLSQASSVAVPGVRLRLVQPDISQIDKWKRGHLDENFQNLLNLSSTPGEKPLTYIIWPETASTFFLDEDEPHRLLVAAHVPLHGALLTGVIRREASVDGDMHFYNSLIAIDHDANVVGRYNKSRLVPYGEYIPFRTVLPIRALASLGVDFSRGDGPHSLSVPGLPSFSPFICYEAIFPGEVVDPNNRPQLLVNVTNDGWYGRTAGPYQHFVMARVRAIEEGLPLARAANTGISAVVDAYGRITARLDLGKAGFIDGDLPQALPPTFFERYGEEPLWLLFTALTVSVLISQLGREKNR